MSKGIVHKASIKHNGETKFYFGSTAKFSINNIKRLLSIVNIPITWHSLNFSGNLKWITTHLVNWDYITKTKAFGGKGKNVTYASWKKTYHSETHQ